jgi:myo-inositol-1(or 4)-monophosphatase
MHPADLAEPLVEMAVRAGRLAQKARQRLVKDLKPDGSVVTNGDREVEQFIRLEIDRLTPGMPVWGEEFGFAVDGGEGVWLVDPVDGTTNYSVGSPLWGVSIGFVMAGAIEIGVVALPDLDEIYLATRGGGVTLNGVPLSPILAGKVMRHELVGYCESVSRLNLKVPGKQRCSGAFVVEGAWVATQRFRGIVGIREHLYDVAPCILMGTELGAEVRYVDGAPLDLEPLLAGDRIGRPWMIFPADSGFTTSSG